MYLQYIIIATLVLGYTLFIEIKFFTKMRFKLSLKKRYHIFSEINERSLTLANRIAKNNKSARIIFTDKEHGEDLVVSKRFLQLDEPINELNLQKIKKEKFIYFMTNNEDENLTESLEFLDKIQKDEEAKVYILNARPEAFIIIDSIMNQQSEKNSKVKVEIVNEVERIILQRLENLPIQKIFNPIKKEVTVLIVGLGNFGQTFLKSITWCFQVIGYSLKIIAVEKNAKEVIEKLNFEAPEILKKYNIQIIENSIETVIAEDLLKCLDINYVIVTAGTDSNNFNIAIALRRYFLRKNKDNVEIDVLIQNQYKSRSIAVLKDEKEKNYNINTFGDIGETYLNHPIIDSDIERMAKGLHSINRPSDVNFIEFYNSEYNRKSLRASVVHNRYKLYSILGDKYTGDIEKDLLLYNELIKDENIVKILAENEHNRWMAYMYADGYKTATMQDVENYYLKVGNNHKNTLAKLHPTLVDNKDILKVEKQVEDVIEKVTGTRIKQNFADPDYEIVQKLYEIYNYYDKK